MKRICELCGKEMESYMQKYDHSDMLFGERGVTEVYPWSNAGKHVICLACDYKVKKELYHPKELNAVECPKGGLVSVDHCNKCGHNWGRAGTISGVRCDWGEPEDDV